MVIINALTKLPASAVELMDSVDLTSNVKPHSKARINAGHTVLANLFVDMVSGLASGDTTNVIKYINRATVKTDCEAILGYSLSSGQATTLLQAPSNIADSKLARVASIARQLQANRATARRTCQHYLLHNKGSMDFHAKLTGFLDECMMALATCEDYQDEEEWNEH